jgi:hypothetical protein
MTTMSVLVWLLWCLWFYDDDGVAVMSVVSMLVLISVLSVIAFFWCPFHYGFDDWDVRDRLNTKMSRWWPTCINVGDEAHDDFDDLSNCDVRDVCYEFPAYLVKIILLAIL